MPTAYRINCTYKQAIPGSGPAVEIHLNVSVFSSKEIDDMAWSAAKSWASTTGKLETQGLAGIGDEAFFVKAQRPGILGTTLVVRKGTSQFSLHAQEPKHEPLEAMKEVEKKTAGQR